MEKGKVLSLEDRIPTIKEHRKRKANQRLIFLLTMFFLLIMCVVYFQSPLSKVKKIAIEGNEKIAAEKILEVTELTEGLNLWKINKKSLEKQLEVIEAIQTAKVSIRFPNIVQIEIKEYKTIGYLLQENTFIPILENGVILTNDGQYGLSGNAPILSGFKEDDVLREMADELQKLPSEIVNIISEIHYAPKETDKYHIYLFTNDGYEVNATIPTFSVKMKNYPSMISQLDPNIKGVIDLEVGSFFKAYETEGEDMNEEGEEE
ncbi:FtsQ-type POTRA domain-containing protein [Bacillus sp. FJAT-50079]|uniref:cell division protein FtsQ/DivIB n=1 Tax=Bacillus sp. FJAT-50079 TaxID=2833577 RepID=UPI001BCA645B|nr:FtsQ-type POTRA domain-containing protein [Bacillus sp. FJAT-50079]MBS4207709.1 FtsQ-type POTRA domain-containing protein [Bacillus sp. FJAT-50079]